MLFDRRGTGLSDAGSRPPTLEQQMDDLRAVLDHAGIERPALYGASDLGLCALYAATYPDQVSAQLSDDALGELRRLLDYCALPFEARCLRFHETERAVRTASSEQVRRPIYRDAIEHWQHFEPYLVPLKEALGRALTDYPYR